MAVPSYDKDRIQPGYDQTEIESCLESLFDQLAEQYPDRVIVWSSWDHENWDRPAKHLCRAFGYNRGKELFNAFGYDVVDAVKAEENDEPAQSENASAEEATELTGNVEEKADDVSSETDSAEGSDEAGEEKPAEDSNDGGSSKIEEPVQIYLQNTGKRRRHNGVTFGQILFILLFLGTAYGVYWIVKFG